MRVFFVDLYLDITFFNEIASSKNFYPNYTVGVFVDGQLTGWREATVCVRLVVHTSALLQPGSLSLSSSLSVVSLCHSLSTVTSSYTLVTIEQIHIVHHLFYLST